MNPELVCEIKVQTAEGKTFRGTGYPITRNRIITTAHMVADAKLDKLHASGGDARHITLSFDKKEPLAGPVYIEWNGEDIGVDVAVLRCELSVELQPTHKLLLTPPATPTEWFAHGYTDFGRQNRPGGKDDYCGTLTKFAGSDATVALGCSVGQITSEQWKGGSGSVAFDSATAQTALAVITEYEAGKKLDHLIAVPICYLLNSASTRERFRSAIEFESYKEREEYYSGVMTAVTSQLRRMNDEPFLTVARKVATIAGADAADIDLKKKAKEVLTEQCATRIVNYSAVTDVVAGLVSLKQILPREEFAQVAVIVDYVLPLNYAPQTIQRLREHVSQGKIGIVADEVATRTVAEIIMAGHDQRPALYIDPFKRKTNDIPGRVAVEPPDDPEAGPDLLPRVWNMFRDLAAEKDVVLGLDAERSRGGRGPESANVELLVEEIEGYARLLRNAIKTTWKIHEGRHLYCVFSPLKNEDHRQVRLQVLEEVAKRVPGLLFVELVGLSRASDQELETRDYIVARLAYA